MHCALFTHTPNTTKTLSRTHPSHPRSRAIARHAPRRLGQTAKRSYARRLRRAHTPNTPHSSVTFLLSHARRARIHRTRIPRIPRIRDQPSIARLLLLRRRRRARHATARLRPRRRAYHVYTHIHRTHARTHLHRPYGRVHRRISSTPRRHPSWNPPCARACTRAAVDRREHGARSNGAIARPARVRSESEHRRSASACLTRAYT